MPELTQSSLEKLLVSLDQDRELAAKKYEILRLGLIRFFEWRGSFSPEDHADEVIDRVALRIDQGEEIVNISRYAIGVARFRWMEITKKQGKEEAALRLIPLRAMDEQSAADEQRLECVRICLRTLPPKSSQVLMAYYQETRRNKIAVRKALARQLSISPHALRMRLQRIRATLEECVTKCLQQKTPKNRPQSP